MDSVALVETGKQILVLIVLVWMDSFVSVPVLAYFANVILLVMGSSSFEPQSVHNCNMLLLQMTLRVSCSLSLYGLLMMMIAFITFKSSLVPLFEGL